MALRVPTGDDRESLGFPDIVTPEQWVLQERKSSWVRPEIYLMIAVLEDALLVFRRTLWDRRPQAQREFDEVSRWFASRSFEGLFSFETVCLVLGVDADGVRRVLADWQGKSYVRRTWSRTARYREGIRPRGREMTAPPDR